MTARQQQPQEHCGHEHPCGWWGCYCEDIPCNREDCKDDTRTRPAAEEEQQGIMFWNMRPEEREELSKCLLDIQVKLPWKEAREKVESINESIKHIYSILDMVKYNQNQCCAKCYEQAQRQSPAEMVQEMEDMRKELEGLRTEHYNRVIQDMQQQSMVSALAVLDYILDDLSHRSCIGRAIEIIEEKRGNGWLREQLITTLRSNKWGERR